MSQARHSLSSIWTHIQDTLFPWLAEELGELTAKQQQLVEVLEVAQIERHLPYVGSVPGHPQKDRSAIARAFVAKAVYDMPTTESLLDRLATDIKLRRICGWEKQSEVPSRSTFSRAFGGFAKGRLAEIVHAEVIERHLGEQLLGHVSRDSTAIVARERPEKKIAEKRAPKKRGRPKKGEIRTPEPTRLQRQSSGLSLKAMIDDLPTACTVGSKRNSKGYKSSWIGYKLHIDAVDGGIPVSCLLSSASLHDSQVAIPLAEMTHRRISYCYDLMDAAYDAPLIKQHSKSLGHIPIIDENPRSPIRKAEIAEENRARRTAGYREAETIRYHERSTVERVNGRLKDEFGGRHLRVRGHTKVMAHLMFGMLVLTVDQLMRFIE